MSDKADLSKTHGIKSLSLLQTLREIEKQLIETRSGQSDLWIEFTSFLLFLARTRAEDLLNYG